MDLPKDLHPDLLPEEEGRLAELNVLLPTLPLLVGERWGEGSAAFWLHVVKTFLSKAATEPLPALGTSAPTPPERIAA
jgi:hypothetical protein